MIKWLESLPYRTKQTLFWIAMVIMAVLIFLFTNSKIQDKKKEKALVNSANIISELMGQNNVYQKNIQVLKAGNVILERERDSIEERIDILNKQNQFNYNLYLTEKNNVRKLPAQASVKLLLANTGNESFPIIQVGKDSSFALPLTTIQRSNVAHLEAKEYKEKTVILLKVVDTYKDLASLHREIIKNDSSMLKDQQSLIDNYVKIEKVKDVQLEIKDKQLYKMQTKLGGTRLFGLVGIGAAILITKFIF